MRRITSLLLQIDEIFERVDALREEWATFDPEADLEELLASWSAGGAAGSRTPSRARADAAAVLGVSVYATEEEIRTAYRVHARAAHPDTGGSAAAFQAVTHARDVMLGGLDA
jgi:hypothetical protein